MKTLFLLPFFLFLSFHFSNAQACVGQPATCSPIGLAQSGLSPTAADLPAVVQGSPVNTVIHFKNYDTTTAFNQLLTIYHLKVDSINNLPSGLCWVMDKANSTYNRLEDGCINIFGSTSAPCGQYKLRIQVLVDIFNDPDPNNWLPFDAEQMGLNYYIRVVGPGAGLYPCLDTTTMAAFVPCVSNPTQCPPGGSLSVSLGGDQSVCTGTALTLTATITGQGPFTYSWSSTGNALSCSTCANPTTTITQNSTYSVTVTNGNNLTATDTISYTASPRTISNYQITANGPTSFCNGGTVTLNAGNGFTSYRWSNNSTLQTLTVAQTGTYSVTVQGTDGCSYIDDQTVTANTTYNGQQICIVSVDAATGKNVIVWEKNGGLGIDSFKVYVETPITGVYQLIRSQPYADFSTYIDAQSNPQQVSSRYAITAVDTCGESPYSANKHKTIHLTSNVGINNEVNLGWNAYEGFSYSSFVIYRGSSQSNLQLLTTVSSTTFSYTDVTPPAPPLFYQIEVVNPNGCVPTAKTESYSSSLSNIIQLNALGIQDHGMDVISMYNYYDESNGENIVQIRADKQLAGILKLYDISGREAFATSDLNVNEIHLPTVLSKGIYIADLRSGTSSIRNKILIR